MIQANDKWFRILIILFPLMVSIYTNGLLQFPVTGIKLGKALVSFICIILVCEGNRFIIYNSRRWAIARPGVVKRNLIIISLGILFSMMILSGSGLIRQYLFINDNI